ncbi:DEAD/DEAH box helicase family protein [Spiroplasma endosymbiont of Cantharis rufa]|uniref:DEAD/DEAH box helicase family protein n=1 Tax=Spiroplasma endosymbiont of Cantharis rufa TaxID=3066279 RepID=UPI0030D2BDC6
MNKFEKGIYDLLIRENDTNFFEENEIEELNYVEDDWLVNQFSKYIKETISKMETLDEKINFFNDISKENKWTFLKAIKKEMKSNDLENISSNKFIKKNLWNNLNKEFQTSENIQMITPFISNQMVNKLNELLENNEEIKSLEIITTTYDGTSKFLALKELIKFAESFSNKVNIKIENLFEANQNRLHIKSYLFNRNNGFSSLYIGSSNFTKTGLITGKEQNIRISEFKDSNIIKEFREEFNKMFNNVEYVDIKDKDKIQSIILRQELQNGANEELRKATKEIQDNIADQFNRLKYSRNDIKPYEYQKEIIDNVLFRIKQNKNKHLLVMATGTGKTKTMLFIYEALANLWKIEEPSILYIAPSKEILDQTAEDFRSYLDIYNFGLEFYDSRNNQANLKNEKWIFSNIETLIRRKEELIEKKFDIVVFDEAHHVEANTFKEIYSILEPNSKQMFGLTATPERTDNINVNKYFGDDYAANLRLFEAIQKELLCDFDYYFIKDKSVDFADIDLQKTKDVNKILNLKQRHEFIYENIEKYIGSNIKNVKAILFCHSAEHAISLSNYLKEKGLKSKYLISESITKQERKDILSDFRNGEINFLCVRDILNEGVDLPEIDSIMFLRPTASLLLYLQQLGRGLRKFTDKRLQIYDFVNNVDIKVNKNFNPLMAINALTNNLQIRDFDNKIDQLNEYLPGESQFILSKIVKEDFLEKLKVYEKSNLYSSIIDEYRTYEFEDYESFFRDKNISIYDFYNSKKSFFKENLNSKNNTIIRQFILFNNENLLKEIYQLLENKRASNNKLVMKLVLASFYYAPKKTDPFYYDLNLAFNMIFESENAFIIKELLFLLKYKLNNEKLMSSVLSEEITSFKGLHLNHNHFLALCSINLRDTNFKGKGQGGIIRNEEDKLLAIDASSVKFSSIHGHGNSYDENKNLFYWDSPNEWKFPLDKIQGPQESLINLNDYKTYVFYSYLKLIEEKGPKAKEFLGYVSSIEGRVKTELIHDSIQVIKPKFIFKIN